MAERMLIINADDLGYDPAVTRGILEAMRDGVVSSATLIVNSPYAEEAAASAAGLAVGLHLNLARFAPIGSGFPQQWLTNGSFSESVAGQLPAGVVEREALAQLDRLESITGRPATHVDAHKHLHRFPSVLDGLCAAAKARRLPVRSIDAEMRRTLRRGGIATPDNFLGEAAQEPYWTIARLRDAVEELPEGVTELMCHPGYSPSAIPSAYSAQRELELRTFTHSSAVALLGRSGVRVANFTVLHG